ncbi:vesicle-associated membrane protein 722-like [Haliotis rufescens]|uniref:vesicle-associated membrane protein 722-like n=1 Tax=Haliotis rufescens TaxID=6454 RepID=UPI00201FA93E|nr:vesicle-associated membrane protein 722-like [Haliotis rufescens]XP_046360299.2 vesicle-associated membrane protein 722-like [Haliotis rufescens]XP_046360306.2 vesicle-associated membrane protein 722-like [Haliotis rufescens]
MPIEYSCISRGTVVLCSRQNGIGSFESTVDSILPNISTSTDGKNTYTSNDYAFHCLVDRGLIYMCAAAPDFGKQQPYAYLAEIKKNFQSGPLAKQASTAESHDLDGDFGFVMSQQMEKYSKPGAGNTGTAKLQNQVDEVKGVMSQNIEKVLERGDRLDDLMDKTEELEASSASFQKTARRIQKKYWWKNTKMTLILIAVVLVIIIIIVVAVLASTGAFSSGKGSTTTAAPAVVTSPSTR